MSEPIRTEPCHKRLRAVLGNDIVFDTTSAWYVWESPCYPTYYVPRADVKAELVATGQSEPTAGHGTASIFDVVAGTLVAAGAARIVENSTLPDLRDTVRFTWAALEQWFEEDEPVYTHARDPQTRVDILASSRLVRVERDGVVLAESRTPRLLFETHLPVRYYLPILDVRQEFLRPSDSVTHCPYKGAATYWSVEVNGRVHPDLVWCYHSPLPESQKIAGLAAFYNERVDLYVDGVLQERSVARIA